MVKNCVAAGCKSTCRDTVSFFKFPSNDHRREQWIRQVRRTRDRWNGPSKHGYYTLEGLFQGSRVRYNIYGLSIAFCAKGILVKIASSLRQLWHQLWEYPGGKSLIRTLFPLFSSVQNRRVRRRRYFLAEENHGYG